jgi:hypothetical protein
MSKNNSGGYIGIIILCLALVVLVILAAGEHTLVRDTTTIDSSTGTDDQATAIDPPALLDTYQADIGAAKKNSRRHERTKCQDDERVRGVNRPTRKRVAPFCVVTS